MARLQILRDNYYAPSLHLLCSRPESPSLQPFPWGPGVGALPWWIFSGMTQIGQCPSQGLALEARHRAPAVINRTCRTSTCFFFLFFKQTFIWENQHSSQERNFLGVGKCFPWKFWRQLLYINSRDTSLKAVPSAVVRDHGLRPLASLTAAGGV